MSAPAPTLTLVENTIHQWVVSATGLAATQVIWKDQNGPRPSRSFVALKLVDSQEIGTGWTILEDRLTTAPAPGVNYRARGQERIRISFEAFADNTVGTATASELLKAIRGKYRLPSIKNLLEALPIGVSQFTSITSLDFLENKTQYLSRATMDCLAYLPTEFVETGYNIETADEAVVLTP